MATSKEKHNKECIDEAAVSASQVAGFSQVETLPDLLKNTPSNIARLEDVIEQSKGRQQYLATTSSPSDGEDVRWYFCKVHLAGKELAASVPRTEIVGKGDYFRFSVRDSLALEASFLQREEELLSHWWKEYAECSVGPSAPCASSSVTSGVQLKYDQSDELYTIDEERVGVPVKGGLYEVDLIKRHCFPVYWHGENRRVLRGHWFARKASLDWLPLREDVTEQLELAYRCRVWHRRTFQPSGLFAARINMQGITPGLHALFTGEDDTWEAWLDVDNSGFANMGKGNGTKLRRGFSSPGSLRPTQDELRQQKEEEMDDYCSQVPVGHLVFMVHGIGQRMEKANLIDDVSNARHITASLAERHLSLYQRGTQRVLFIPCQWRKCLKFRGESAVEKITLDGVPGLRQTLSATVHDVLYYMSPIYCQEIIDSVSTQLNRLFNKFLKRNPGYHGKVSLYGHSLGSVLSYDILCHQETFSSPFPMDDVYMGSNREEESRVDACNQFCESSYAPTLENNHTDINVETSESTSKREKVSSGPNSNATNLEEKFSDLSVTDNPSFTSDTKDGFTKKQNGSQDSLLQSMDDRQTSDVLVFEEDCQKYDCHSKDTVGSEQAALDAKACVTSEPPSVVDNVTVNPSEYVSEKDKVITLLEEEVKSLKTRITALQLSKNDTTSINEEEAQRKSYTPCIQYTKLDFEVDTFFAVGSPLGVFLALRNVRIGIGRGQDYWQDERISEEMPSCRKMFNIFHPFDPVAYRVEPLICKEYISKRPVIIPYHKGGKKLHIGFQEFTEDINARSRAVVSHLNSMKVKVVNVFRSSKEKMQESVEDDQVKEKSYGSIMMERLTGSEDGRIDHMLQDQTFQHAYISALGAHTNYWRDHDTALFILKHLYRDIPEEPETQMCEESYDNKAPVEMFANSEVLDEDTPLTFSDRSLIQEFSRKARMTMKSA